MRLQVSYKHGEAIILHQWANCGDVLVNCQSAYPQSFICQARHRVRAAILLCRGRQEAVWPGRGRPCGIQAMRRRRKSCKAEDVRGTGIVVLRRPPPFYPSPSFPPCFSRGCQGQKSRVELGRSAVSRARSAARYLSRAHRLACDTRDAAAVRAIALV